MLTVSSSRSGTERQLHHTRKGRSNVHFPAEASFRQEVYHEQHAARMSRALGHGSAYPRRPPTSAVTPPLSHREQFQMPYIFTQLQFATGNWLGKSIRGFYKADFQIL